MDCSTVYARWRPCVTTNSSQWLFGLARPHQQIFDNILQHKFQLNHHHHRSINHNDIVSINSIRSLVCLPFVATGLWFAAHREDVLVCDVCSCQNSAGRLPLHFQRLALVCRASGCRLNSSDMENIPLQSKYHTSKPTLDTEMRSN